MIALKTLDGMKGGQIMADETLTGITLGHPAVVAVRVADFAGFGVHPNNSSLRWMDSRNMPIPVGADWQRGNRDFIVVDDMPIGDLQVANSLGDRQFAMLRTVSLNR